MNSHRFAHHGPKTTPDRRTITRATPFTTFTADHAALRAGPTTLESRALTLPNARARGTNERVKESFGSFNGTDGAGGDAFHCSKEIVPWLKDTIRRLNGASDRMKDLFPSTKEHNDCSKEMSQQSIHTKPPEARKTSAPEGSIQRHDGASPSRSGADLRGTIHLRR